MREGGAREKRGWKVGEERAGSQIPKVAGTGEVEKKFRNVSQYFA